jgi:integrase
MARKRVPADVREEFCRLYGDGMAKGWEARLVLPAMGINQARQRHRAWLTEIEIRVANIRAQRCGDRQQLTPRQVRGLAGDWYRWFVLRHKAKGWPAAYWDQRLEELRTEFEVLVWHAAGGSERQWSPEVEAVEQFQRHEKAREQLRPKIADWCELHQFEADHGLKLDQDSRDMLIDGLIEDLWAALVALVRHGEGDDRVDPYVARFPPSVAAAPERGEALTVWQLFEVWVEAVKPAAATVARWRSVFLRLQEDCPEPAAFLTRDQAQQWARGLVTPERQARTVRDIWIVAARTVLNWAQNERLISNNPFTGWRFTVPRRSRTREGKAFTLEEAQLILGSALAVREINTRTDACRRWAPWLCAYTGARVGEITQLRRQDVAVIDGIAAIQITPEAGTVKTGQALTVPLHRHLLDQDFLGWVEAQRAGPLFHNLPGERRAARTAVRATTNPGRALAVKAREHLGVWVRALGVKDREIRPNHAWRHLFKKIGHQAGISERLLDALCGHAPATTGRKYGAPELAEKAEAISRFPRFELGRAGGRAAASAEKRSQVGTRRRAEDDAR